MKIVMKIVYRLFDLAYKNGEVVGRMVFGLLIGIYVSIAYVLDGERISIATNPILYVTCCIVVLLLVLRMVHAVLLERRLLREAGAYCVPYVVGLIPPILFCTVLR